MAETQTTVEDGRVSPELPKAAPALDTPTATSAPREALPKDVHDVLHSEIGLNTLLDRLKQSIASARDFSTFLKKRSTIEEDHAKALKRLARVTSEAVHHAETRQGTYARQLEQSMRTHEKMADNGVQFALSLHQMHEDLLELTTQMERGRKNWKHEGLSSEKKASDAEFVMHRAKTKYETLAEDYDRARTGDLKGSRKFIKGPKSAAQYEEDLLRKLQASDADYQDKVNGAKSQRQELLNSSRPRAIRALQDLVQECDSALALQLQKFATFNEKLLLGNGILITPLPSENASSRSLRDIMTDIDNDQDFHSHVLAHKSKVPQRISEIEYVKHPTQVAKQYVPPPVQEPSSRQTSATYTPGAPAPLPKDSYHQPAQDGRSFSSNQVNTAGPVASGLGQGPQDQLLPTLPPQQSRPSGDYGRSRPTSEDVPRHTGPPASQYNDPPYPSGPRSGQPSPQHGPPSQMSPQYGSQSQLSSPQYGPSSQLSPQHGPSSQMSPQYNSPSQLSPQHGPPSQLSPQHGSSSQMPYRNGTSSSQAPYRNEGPQAQASYRDGPPLSQAPYRNDTQQTQAPYRDGNFQSQSQAPTRDGGPQSQGQYRSAPSQSQVSTRDAPPQGQYRDGASQGQAPYRNDYQRAQSPHRDGLSQNAGPRTNGAVAAPPLPSSNGSKLARPVFGVDLEELFQRDGSAVPMVVYQCMQGVDLFGLSVEGIYRQNGSAQHLQQLKAQFDHDASKVDFRNPASFYHDVNSVAGLLKQFFRDLPDPLLTRERYAECIAAAKIEDETVRRDTLHAVINGMPDANYATLRAVVLHLNRVQEHQGQNRMSSSNLAICFAPSLMGVNAGAQIQDSALQARVIDTILLNTYQIFDED